MNILVTSGGTQVKIDEVRHIGNMSSGKFGSEIAAACLKLRNSVQFLHAKHSVAPHKYQFDCLASHTEFKRQLAEVLKLSSSLDGHVSGYEPVEYDTFDDYLIKLRAAVDKRKPSMMIMAAAVSDYGCEAIAGKTDSSKELTLKLQPLPKIISMVKQWHPNAFLVGFKLLVGSDEAARTKAALRQIEACNTDVVVVNDIREMRAGKHTLYLYSKRKAELETTLVGEDLADRLVGILLALKNAVAVKQSITAR